MEDKKTELEKGTYAKIKTNMGDITCKLFKDKAPKTVENFIGLATGTKEYIHHETKEATKSNFYDGIIFHRVIPGFMIQTGDPMGMGYGGQFVEYKGPNNVQFNMSIDSMYDDRTRNKLMHPEGGVVESYRYDIMDIGTSDGAPNIQKVEVKGQPIIHRYIPGLRNPFDPDGKMSAIGTAEDAWEEHKWFQGAAIVRDPSRTASFIHNLQAGYVHA